MLTVKLSQEKVKLVNEKANSTKLAGEKAALEAKLLSVGTVAAAELAAAVAAVQKEMSDEVIRAMKEGHTMAMDAMRR